MSDHCANCGTALKGKFCHSCGQLGQPGRITMKETFQQFLSSVFSLEGPLIFTLKKLLTKPGQVYRDFIEGKRKHYYKPVSLFILLTAIYIIIRSVTGFNPLEGNIPPEPVDPSNESPMARQVVEFFVNNVNYIMFFAAFSIGFMMKLFFWKNHNLAEYLTIGLYITSIYVIIGILIMIASLISGGNHTQFQMPLLFLLVLLNMFSFYKSFRFFHIVRYVLTAVLSSFFYVLFGLGFSLLVVSLKNM